MSTDSTEIAVSSHAIEVADNATLRTLMDMGLIRKVLSEGKLRYDVTNLGLQCVADYEHIERYSKDFSNHKTLLTSTAIDLLRSIEAENAYDVHLFPREGVTIVIPTLNEGKNIRILLKRMSSVLHEMPEIIVVDGGSSDETPLVAARLGAKVITQKETGKGDAMRQVFAGSYHGKIIVTMDADGSNRPEEIPHLVDAIVNGADVAKGSRFLKGGGSTDLSWVRNIGNKFFVSIVNLFWSAQYTDLCYGFMAFRKEALARIAPLLESKHFQIETEICIEAKKLGLKVVEIPSVELKRQYGASKLRGVHDSISILGAILRELFTSHKSDMSMNSKGDKEKITLAGRPPVVMFVAKPYQRPNPPRTIQEAQVLSTASYPVYVFAWDREAEFPAHDEVDGVIVHSFTTMNFKFSRVGLILGSVLFQIGLFLQTVRLVNHLKQRPIVHAHDINTLVPACLLRRLGLSVGLVYDCREMTYGVYSEWFHPFVGAIVRTIENRCLHRVDTVITVTDPIATYLLNFNKSVDVIYNCPRLSDIPNVSRREARIQLGLPLDAFIVSSIGTIRLDCALELLVDVASRLATRHQ